MFIILILRFVFENNIDVDMIRRLAFPAPPPPNGMVW